MTKTNQQEDQGEGTIDEHWITNPQNDIEPDTDELKKLLIEANGEVSTALEELQYAQDNDLTHENMDEIADMIKSAIHGLDVFLQEVE